MANRDISPEELNNRPLPETESALISCKFDFENAISKCQADLKFNEQQLEFQTKNIVAIEQSLNEENEKLESLRTAREGGVDNYVEKLKEDF